MKVEVVIAIYVFALLASLVALAALLAYIGIVLGARVPLLIRFVWPFGGTFGFGARAQYERDLAGQRQLAEDILRNVQPVSEDRQRQILNALAQTRVGAGSPIDNVVLFDPRR
jgi:hypothetical protein